MVAIPASAQLLNLNDPPAARSNKRFSHYESVAIQHAAQVAARISPHRGDMPCYAGIALQDDKLQPFVRDSSQATPSFSCRLGQCHYIQGERRIGCTLDLLQHEICVCPVCPNPLSLFQSNPIGMRRFLPSLSNRFNHRPINRLFQ